MNVGETGRLLIIVGAIFLISGLALVFAGRIPWVGRLPGDLLFQRDGFSCYLPLATMLILSAVLTVVLNAVLKMLNR